MKRGGTTMSLALRAELESDPEYQRCAFGGYEALVGKCEGRITREHAIIQAGKKLQERWAIVPCCAKHHGVDFHQDGHQEAPKRMRVWVALNRATELELLAYPKSNYLRERELMNRQYGEYIAPQIPEKEWTIRPKAPTRRLTEGELFTREVRAYARVNGLDEEVARAELEALV